jgi:hypothetical protein
MAVGRSNTTERNWLYGLAKKREWLVEWVIPGLFVLILLACLSHLVYSALQGSVLPTSGLHYATSAFAS